MGDSLKVIGLFGMLLVAHGCSSARFYGRSPASDDPGTAFDHALSELGLKAYSANLHSHHFMRYVPPKKDRARGEVLSPGACAVNGSFPEDDGKPCRDDAQKQNLFAGPSSDATADRTGYFKMACEYARDSGELDILFVTPHTKDGKAQSDTSTVTESLSSRQKLLKGFNAQNEQKIYCGLGQEASSISTGNHIGILGHFSQNLDTVEPFFFAPGDFKDLYSQVRTRVAKGEKIILSLNHPDVRDDLWWKDTGGQKPPKGALNDYGLDDFSPVGCLLKPTAFSDCQGTPTKLTHEMLKETFAKIRDASADSIRYVEMISPGGAAENSSTEFRPVHHRVAEDGTPTDEMSALNKGLYDYVFYLAMGLRVAPLANQDNHYANWGTATASRTGLLSASLDEADVFESLYERRSFASEDKNAKMVLFAQEGDPSDLSRKTVMGGEMSISSGAVTLSIGYQDPDTQDRSAHVRIYYYRSSENLDFSRDADPTQVFRRGDSLPIESGQVIRVRLPMEKGEQYLFAEITQDADNDKLYSAPIWISR